MNKIGNIQSAEIDSTKIGNNEVESKINTNGYNFERLCKAMFWSKLEDAETWEEVAERNQVTSLNHPHSELIDVVYYNGVEVWAEFQDAESLEELQSNILKLFQLALSDKILSDSPSQKIFRRIYNFCTYVTNLDRQGRLYNESEKIADIVFHHDIAPRLLKKKLDELFSIEPDKNIYFEASNKLKEVYKFSDTEIDALRYFVCQVRNLKHNPSLNKSIYLFSEQKQTGKTSVARTIASILNGENSLFDGTKFESDFATEMQIRKHALPFACKFNCVILDEAIPDNSERTYGRIKSNLTSDNVIYDRKFVDAVTLKARRNYIFTSNNHINEFIQDDTERRFIQILFREKPKYLRPEEIFELWKSFIINCEPEPDINSWYNSFSHIEGVQRLDIEQIKAEIISNNTILEMIKNLNRYQLSRKFFEDLLTTGKPTRKEKKALENALIELFGKPTYSNKTWQRISVANLLEEHQGNEFKQETEPDEEGRDKIPF